MSKRSDAIEILVALGMPKRQQNDNAIYTLLAFADVGPKTPWIRARDIRLNPHGVIAFAARRYGKKYQENTRETIRRQAIHQFVQGAILLRNPDEPGLPTNSPRTHYAMSPEALAVVKAYGTAQFEELSIAFRDAAGGGLASVYAKLRNMSSVPVRLPDGQELRLSPGAHNVLQRDVVEKFLPRFAPKAQVLYLGDTDHKTLLLDEEGLRAIGIPLGKHDKLPDIVALDPLRNWLFLIEAVTSHGPVTGKRQLELTKTLEKCKIGSVYVSAFTNFKEFKKHADEIAWETEVWLADMPDPHAALQRRSLPGTSSLKRPGRSGTLRSRTSTTSPGLPIPSRCSTVGKNTGAGSVQLRCGAPAADPRASAAAAARR